MTDAETRSLPDALGLAAADRALYAAKHRGRNSVVEHGLVRATDTGLKLVC